MNTTEPTYDNSPEFSQTTALAESANKEMAVNRDIARAVQEVQGAIIVAQRFRRNEDEARAKLLRACKRPMFADEAEYAFPRGGKEVAGPSITLAREAARVWGNIQYGFEVIAEDHEWRAIRCFAWDVETNSRAVQEDRFKKLIFRKGKGWIEPDERDLRELTNRRAAIGYRNCILQLIPKDIIDEAMMTARGTLKDKAAQDPDGERKRIVDAFADINIMPTTLEQILGHKLAEASPAEITHLRGVYRSIRDGNSTISEYLPGNQTQDVNLAGKAEANLESIKNRYIQQQPQPQSQPSVNPSQPTSSPAQMTPAPEEKGQTQSQRSPKRNAPAPEGAPDIFGGDPSR